MNLNVASASTFHQLTEYLFLETNLTLVFIDILLIFLFHHIYFFPVLNSKRYRRHFFVCDTNEVFPPEHTHKHTDTLSLYLLHETLSHFLFDRT